MLMIRMNRLRPDVARGISEYNSFWQGKNRTKFLLFLLHGRRHGDIHVGRFALFVRRCFPLYVWNGMFCFGMVVLLQGVGLAFALHKILEDNYVSDNLCLIGTSIFIGAFLIVWGVLVVRFFSVLFRTLKLFRKVDGKEET